MRLTHLTLREPGDDSALFRSLFCRHPESTPVASFLSRPEHLSLHRFDSIVSTIPAPEFSAAFASMTSLRHLVLDSVEGVDDLLPFVALISGLTKLDIWPDYDDFHDFQYEFPLFVSSWRNTAPTVPALQSMLQTSSAHVTLYGCDTDALDPPADPLDAFDRLDPERFTIDADLEWLTDSTEVGDA